MFFQETTSKIQSVVKSPVVAVQAPFDFDSVLLGTKHGQRSIIICVVENFMFVYNQINNQRLLQSVANGIIVFCFHICIFNMIINCYSTTLKISALGYNTVTQCRLSGGYIPSLIQTLIRNREITKIQDFVSQSVSKQAPSLTQNGLDFTHVDYLKNSNRNKEHVSQFEKLTIGHHTKTVLNGNTVDVTIDLTNSDDE